MKSQTQKTMLLGFLASIACCAVVGVYCLLVGQLGHLQERVLATTAAVAAASILGLICAIPWERRLWHPIGPAGAVAVAVALVLLLIFIWAERWIRTQRIVPDYERVLGTACVAAVACSHVALLSLARLQRSYHWVRRATVIAIIFLALLITVVIWERYVGNYWMRIIGVFLILTTCGTIAVPILHRISRIRQREGVKTVDLSLAVTCPRCGLAQELSVGRSTCMQCSLRFLIEIEEDSCPTCGYPLYQLTSSACPECGRPIQRTNEGS